MIQSIDFYVVHCDSCPRQLDLGKSGIPTYFRTRREAREAAEREGWVKSQQPEGWICRECRLTRKEG